MHLKSWERRKVCWSAFMAGRSLTTTPVAVGEKPHNSLPCMRHGDKPCHRHPGIPRFQSWEVSKWRIGPACCGQLYRCRYRRKATKPKHEIQPTDIVLFDNNACSMVVCGFYSDSFMGYTAKAYYQNKTDDRIDVILDKGSINGFECTPEGAALLEPHSNA